MTGINGISDPFLQKYNSDLAANMSEQKAKQSQHMRELLRNLKQTPVQNENPYSAMSKDKAGGFLDLTETRESEKEDDNDIPYNYNFKEVEGRIQRAKTSASAGQAVASARRKVLEVRRKMASSKENAEELQLALTHARRMEMVAKKKKHHLELEEIAQTVRERDEKLEKQEQAAAMAPAAPAAGTSAQDGGFMIAIFAAAIAAYEAENGTGSSPVITGVTPLGAARSAQPLPDLTGYEGVYVRPLRKQNAVHWKRA